MELKIATLDLSLELLNDNNLNRNNIVAVQFGDYSKMSGRKLGCHLNQVPLLTNVQTVSQITANKEKKFSHVE